MTTPPLLDMATVEVSRDDDGAVLFDDGGPWLVRVWTGPGPGGRRRISRLQVDLRPGAAAMAITATRLARLPVAQFAHIAATRGAHENEVYYRMLAAPKPAGQRSWPDDHWDRVLTVARWALETGRPGGGRRAVADMWDVAVGSTAKLWLSTARRRQREGRTGGTV